MKQTIANKIYRKKTIDKINSKIKLLGLNQRLDAVQFLNIRLIVMIVMFILIFIFSKIGYILAPVISIVFYYLMEYLVLDYQAKIRGKALEKEALFFFEVFVLTLESGRNLRQALILTTENVDSEISNEFKKTLAEVRLGKSLNEALE